MRELVPKVLRNKLVRNKIVRNNIVRNNKDAWFFLAAALAASALRLFFVVEFPAVVDDSRLYGNIAENWLQHGVYGITNSGVLMPTLSRLPGYPAFLAAIFALFGAENFRAVLLVQVLFDLGTCFLIADLALHLFSPRAAKAAFLLAGLCPFLANYAAAALTETLEIFVTTLALNLALRSFGINRASPREPDHVAQSISEKRISGNWSWLACGLSVGAAILLRPDGGILLIAIGAYLLWMLLRALRSNRSSAPAAIFFAGLVFTVGAVSPLVPWTLRNLHTMHRFEPLAPRYANDADEPPMSGFNRWVKTWIADYVSVEEIYWNVPGDAIEITRLPSRAFDSPQQHDETARLFADYNHDHDLTPELDAGFAALAADRVHASFARYYVWLPALRIADMWMRPRTELLSADPRWWEFNDEPRWLAVSMGFGIINLLFFALAVAGLLRAHNFSGIGIFVLFLLLRSAFLGTLENPEPRYTLECYPVIILLASALFHSRE